MIIADSIEIAHDDEGYRLVVEGLDGRHVIDIQGIVFDFYAAVQREIRPYVLEAEDARREFVQVADDAEVTVRVFGPAPITSRPMSVEDAIAAGYALDDPKSPGYHDRMVD
jgi:hypothetical protein